MEPVVVAVDIGFGNAKGVVGEGSVIIPSVVAVPGGPLGLAGMGMKSARRALRITFERGDFFVGSGAGSWGRVVENMDFSRLASPEAEALLYAVMARLVGEGAVVRLVVGLPVPLLQDEVVARPVMDALRVHLMGEHRVEVDGKPFTFQVVGVRAAAQPVGAWAEWALDGAGRWAHGVARSALVGVVDIGFNTVDLYGIRGGRLEPRLAGGEKVGVRRLLELAAPGVPYHQADERLRAAQYGPRAAHTGLRAAQYGNACATWLSEVVGAGERIWGGARLDMILLVGGGALLIGEHVEVLRRAFRAEVLVPADPVAANARGLWKWGQAVRW